jgi:hypothetical protein
VLTKTVLEFDQDLLNVDLSIVSAPDKHRRVRASGGRKSRAAIESLATDYLRRLELDPVIQVAGRVRFATSPREVVLFQMADLSNELPGCTDVANPTELRAALGLPDPKSLDHERFATVARRRMDAGATARQVASELSVGRATVFRRLKEAESLKTPIEIYSYRRIETLDGQSPSTGGSAA